MTHMTRIKIAVLGAGNIGTVMAHVLASNGHEVAIWDFFPEVVKDIRLHRENRRFLPSVRLHGGVRAILLGCLETLSSGARNVEAAALNASIHEMAAIARAHGGQASTLYGLAGLGDLVATGFSLDGLIRVLQTARRTK